MAPSKEKLVEAIEKNLGVLSRVAESFGVNRSTVHNWVKKLNLESELGNARETTIDIAEHALYKNIREGNVASIIFFLKTQGRKRGYNEETPEAKQSPIDLSKLSAKEVEILKKLTDKAKID